MKGEIFRTGGCVQLQLLLVEVIVRQLPAVFTVVARHCSAHRRRSDLQTEETQYSLAEARPLLG